MRMHQSGAAVLAAATVLLSASTSPPTVHQQPRPPQDAHPGIALASVPAQWSFDDLAPTESAALTRDAAPVPAKAAPSRPPRPPRAGAVGSSPAAGTPQAVLAAAYRHAVSKAPRGCHLRTEHLAAIGQVESGSIGGRSVTSDHRVTPAIFGPLLDGGPFAVVRDSDDGSYDGDSQYDRAMGPLQFLPGTWTWAGRDGDGDGQRDPQNVFDAALATAGYLCLEGRDLSGTGDLRSAVLSYNQSEEYHAAVVGWVAYFRQHGLAALTSVAFRVGSGGRASELADPEPEPAPPPTAPAAAATDGTTTPSRATPKPSPAPSPTPTTPRPVAEPPAVPVPQPTTAVPTSSPTTTTPPPSSTTPPEPDPEPTETG